ncbi:MAG: right-handed parallel beta-helix repeat-containing protein, partial [Thermoplasmata archaeon]|nr:right-handed parallel beta-helix repeat-containing protein [Thermoplasmata archaeon]
STAALIQNSWNISLDRVYVNVTDGVALDLNTTDNVTLTDSILNGSRVSSMPERPLVNGWETGNTSMNRVLVGFGDEAPPVSPIKSPAVIFDPTRGGMKFENSTFESENRDTLIIKRKMATATSLKNGKIFNCSIRTKNGTGLRVVNCQDFQVVESFFDVLFNTTDTNNTGVDIFNSSATTFEGCGIEVTNGNGLVVDNGPFLRLNLTSINVTGLGPSLSGNFAFKQTNTPSPEKKSLENCNISANNADAIFVDWTDNFQIDSCNILAVNGSGVSASNGTGVWVNRSGINIPHARYNDRAVRFKAIARGGCAETTATVAKNGTGFEMWGSNWLYMKRIMVKANDAIGFRIINCTNTSLEKIDLDGTNSTDPERPCEGIEAYGWELGGITLSNVTGFKGNGLNLTDSSKVNVTGNKVKNSGKTGIRLSGCSEMKVYHNNIIGNGIQAYDDTGLNSWNDSYPSGGNYWSDYAGPDLMSGPLQNLPGLDGIGDVPYEEIKGWTGTADAYPLMEPWTPPPVSFFNISLNAGWNLISIPLEMDDTSIADVLASISGKYDSVKAYDSLDFMDPWKSYRQNGTANDLVSIGNTLGVWVHATEACTLAVSGYVPTTTAIPLYAGWNLVGYPTLTPRAAGDALAGTGFDMLECYDPASPYIRAMGPLEMMTPGCGYWVHVPADTVWTVDW